MLQDTPHIEPGSRPVEPGSTPAAVSGTLHTLRCSQRLPLVLPARCRSRSGFLDRVVMTDLSPEGCRIESRALTIHPGDLVALRPEALEMLCGEVRWVAGHSAGIRFDAALYPPVVDHLHRLYATFLPPAGARGMPHLRAAA